MDWNVDGVEILQLLGCSLFHIHTVQCHHSAPKLKQFVALCVDSDMYDVNPSKDVAERVKPTMFGVPSSRHTYAWNAE